MPRRLSPHERRLYTRAAGRPPPPCLVQRWRWWPSSFHGLALGWLVFVRDDENVPLVCHEVEHVAQFCAHPLTFWLRYLRALARVGYRENPYEQQARQVGARAAALLRVRR